MTTHGTRACYTGGCRRPECRRANSDYQRDWLRALPACYTLTDLVEHLLDQARRYPAHGTPARYRRGCSCDDCRAANTARVIHNRRHRVRA